MNFKVYELTDGGWSKTLQQIPTPNKDINFLPEWYQTWVLHENNAEALCVRFTYDDFIFLYPFFRKKINNFDLANDYYDIQSAYGYGGVIVNKTEVPAEISKTFNKYVTEWLQDNRVIAEFIRDHPLLNNCRREADYVQVRKNVLIETANYKIPDKSARQNVSKAIASDCLIFYDEKCQYMNDFAYLYMLTAERLQLRDFYRFSPSYFNQLKKHLAPYIALIHILKDDTIVASGLYLKYHEKGNLHLTASKVEYQILRANDLLFYAAIQHSINNQVKILNIGGGLGNDPNDTLLRFKSKFGHNLVNIHIGKNIHNREVYDKITRTWERRHPDLVGKYNNYFLKYHQQA